MTDVVEALLEAHVRHELERLSGPKLEDLIREGVAATLVWLEEVKLNDVVTREQIVAVIDRYVISFKVSGGITDVAGEMSNVVFSSPSATATRIDDILPTDAFEDFADKVASLESAQREVLHYITQSAAVRTLASRLVHGMALDLLLRSGDRLPPSLKSFLGGLGEKLFPAIQRRVGSALSAYVEEQCDRLANEGSRQLLAVLDPEWLREMADELWDAISSKPIADAAQVFTAQDLEDFVVLGYEYWKKFRKTPYFRSVSTEVVARLFEKYGNESVRSVISDMGISEEMIADAVRSFVPPLVEHALRTGFLEQQLRAHLEPFYRSARAMEVLGQSR
jgi:hypothetical protein